jgi:hypothetical protein
MRERPSQDANVSGIMMQVNEAMVDNEAETSGNAGKKKREEREWMLAVQAENEKLVDKDWREGRFPGV